MPSPISSRAVRLPLLFLVAAGCALPQSPSLEVRIVTETVPPGGLVQLKVALTDPHPISSGTMSTAFDSSFFDTISGIALFSPNGDTAAAVVVHGTSLKASFLSKLGAYGSTLDYPIMTIATRMKPGLPRGTHRQVSLDANGSTWQDLLGRNYPYTLKNGTIVVDGNSYISDIVPGGGALPAGYVVKILGGGFTPFTRLFIDGVKLSRVQYAGPAEIDVTLAEAADLTGARVRLQTPGSPLVTYYSYLRPASVGSSTLPLLAATVPVFSRDTAVTGFLPVSANGFTAVAFQNSSLAPVSLNLDLLSATGAVTAIAAVTLPPASRYARELSEIFGSAAPAGGGVRFSAGAGIQALGLAGDNAAGIVKPVAFLP